MWMVKKHQNVAAGVLLYVIWNKKSIHAPQRRCMHMGPLDVA